MQCSSCRFQNMPGTEVCGRCGTSLGIATAVIDVHPPRAKPLTKRLRRRLPVRRAMYGVRGALGETATAAAARRVSAALPPGPVLARMPLPGWAHFYTGRRARGHAFVWCFLACLLPGLLLWGSGWGSVFVGLAFSVHSSAALDVINLAFPRFGFREVMSRSVAVTLVLGVAVYWPAGRLLTRVADPRVMATQTTRFARDDVVLVNHWAAPSPGSVVLYDIPPRTIREHDGHRAVNTVYQGERVERILAGPGDHVLVQGGLLWINGGPAPHLPLNTRRLPARLAQTVPPDHYFILPSTTEVLPNPADAAAWEGLSMVPAESVRGIAYARSQPLSRFEVIR
jgi:hypothetical protein